MVESRPLRPGGKHRAVAQCGGKRGVGRGTDVGDSVAQLLEFQRLVLHRRLVATLALAVEPIEQFRRDTKGSFNKVTEQGFYEYC